MNDLQNMITSRTFLPSSPGKYLVGWPGVRGDGSCFRVEIGCSVVCEGSLPLSRTIYFNGFLCYGLPGILYGRGTLLYTRDTLHTL